jgi:hypothetical protein
LRSSSKSQGNAVATEPDAHRARRGDFDAAAERTLEASLAATPAERLRWLEEALAFAMKMGALPRRD